MGEYTNNNYKTQKLLIVFIKSLLQKTIFKFYIRPFDNINLENELYYNIIL